jgi:trk system potassium uptake protein TrkH
MKLINPLIIIRILSTILIIETISLLLCLPVVFIYGESPNPFLYSSGITLLLSIILYIISRNCNFENVSNKDGYLAVTLSWLLLTLMGTLPYIFSGTIPAFTDAFFESASGFTTTGSTILKNVEALPFSILFWRSFTQWIGGIGIIVLVVIILPSLMMNGYQLFTLESSLSEKIHPRTQAIGYRIMFIYLGLSVTQIILLNLGDMNLFDSICHTFGTVSTGGFSTKNLKLTSYSSYSQYIVMIFMFLAGISQLVYYHFFKANMKKVKQNEELWFYISAVLIAGTIVSVILHFNSAKAFESSFREGFFQVISIITTTGYSSADYLLWPVTATILIFILMFSGGMTGSTSGGIKMARHLVVLKNIKNVFVKLNHPNAISPVKLNGKVVDENTNVTIVSFVALYLFIFVLGTIFVTVTGVDNVTAASSVASCMAGIGPGLGTVGPMGNYAHFPEISKIVLSILMILGRLEIITVFALFTRTFWKM